MSSAPYEWFVGTRYLLASQRGGRRNGFISFISLISIVGLALGVAVLIIVLSVMNGFETELRQRILGMTAHATVMGLEGRMTDWEKVRGIALKNPAVTAAAPYIEDQGMLVKGSQVSGVQVRGVLPEAERQVSTIEKHMTAGKFADLKAGDFRIVLGEALARELRAKVGDSVILIVAKGNATPVGVVPRMRKFTVSGIFSAGMYEYDRGMAFVAMSDAARLYRLGGDVTGVRLSVKDLFAAPRIVHDIALSLGGDVYIYDWTRKHANFFRSIETAKRMLFFILLLVMAVAAFNIVSTLVMVVKDKQGDIAILRTMGSTPRAILRIFIVQGAVIGLLGTLAGVALGMLVSGNLEALVHGLERLLSVQFLDAKVYFMSDLPAEVREGDVLLIAGTAFLLCCLSTLYPAWRAARSQPAEALRHE